MGNASTNVANIQQTVTNNILQDNQQNCTFSNQDTADNNVIVIQGSKVRGNFTGVNVTSKGTDATCLLASNMGTSVSSILSASLQQSNKTESDWFGGFSFSADTNTFNVRQATTNQINQINQSTCSSSNTQSANNNYIYIANSSAGGNFVGVNNSVGQATASCSMQNTMKAQTYNDAQSSGGQGNVEKGMFVSMVGSFTTMIGLVVLLVIILFAVGAIGYIGYSATSKPKATAATTAATGTSLEEQEDAELALYDQFGGTGFITGTTTA